MDDYCYAKMATSAKREHERESAPEKKTKYEDVQQLIGHPEELPPQSEGKSSTLKQETPQPPHIKKEEEELCITQEGECLLGREEADYTKLPLTVVSVKTEDDEEKPHLDNLLTPLPDREVEKLLSSKTDCEGDMRTHTDNKHSECSKKKTDVQKLIGQSEELPPQLGGNSTLKQETPQPPCIKKEEEELWITQEGECLLGPQEADLTKLPLTVVSVKTEDDEEKSQPDNLLAPLSDSEAEDEAEEPLSSETDCEGDMRTHTDSKHSTKKRGKRRYSCSVCDVQQLIGHPEELPPQSEGKSSTLKQETPQPPCIKKEEEELCITQEGECLLGREEADYTKLPLTVVSVKTEDDEEKPHLDNHLTPLPDREVEKLLSSKTDCEDVQQLIGQSEERPPQLGGNSTLKQETPQPPCIKKEEEELWITQEGECLLGPQEADLTKLPLTVVSVKTEDDEEKSQPDNLLAPLSDSEAEDEAEEPLSSETDCEGDMRTHTDSKHSTKKRGKRRYSCSVCGKGFSRKSILTRHMRTHTGEKPFKCSVCGKSFSQKGHLIEHMRTHTGEKTFNCLDCCKSFTRKSHLTQHMRSHTGEKPFKCSVCGKSFSQKIRLTEHTRTHTGEKPFNCSVCGKSFPRNSDVTQHMRTHTGEKPFKCSVCGKSFPHKTNLIQHMRTHTGEKTYICSVCGKSFSRKNNMIQHMTTHTG
ncbi:zinc finger protein 239-like isoform X2 [Entelurus aequoreus]|uniref:zinc finger protein 239-like isoform X2 n=1 Tax=Entelurus aequoreus TaxID=161455 RepID=UPI002B1DC1EE|nr:zinc finger protein 239-like isoform X2 [Entelurus aequoreus]